MTTPSNERTPRPRDRSRRGFAQATLVATVAALLLSLTVALVAVSIGIARADAFAAHACGRDATAGVAGHGGVLSHLRKAAYP